MLTHILLKLNDWIILVLKTSGSSSSYSEKKQNYLTTTDMHTEKKEVMSRYNPDTILNNGYLQFIGKDGNTRLHSGNETIVISLTGFR